MRPVHTFHTFASHVGNRENNEDSYLALPGVYAVADGMGGHPAGEVASRIVVEHLRGNFPVVRGLGASEQVFRTCFDACNRKLLDYMQRHPATHGMGTTLTALVFDGSTVIIGHVGDSRCYRVRAGRCEQITRDHNAPGLAPASFSAEEKQDHWPLLNCLGARSSSYRGADVFSMSVLEGDVFVLATDGLELTVYEIGVIVECKRALPRADIAGALVQSMLRKGANDNVTVVAVRIAA